MRTNVDTPDLIHGYSFKFTYRPIPSPIHPRHPSTPTPSLRTGRYMLAFLSCCMFTFAFWSVCGTWESASTAAKRLHAGLYATALVLWHEMYRSNPGRLETQTPRQLLAHIRESTAIGASTTKANELYPVAPMRGKEVASAAQAVEVEGRRHVCETCLCVCAPPPAPKTHHCSLCNRCMAGFDHHCHWIGACVGAHNRWLFLLCTTVYIVLGFYQFGLYLNHMVHACDYEGLKAAALEEALSGAEAQDCESGSGSGSGDDIPVPPLAANPVGEFTECMVGTHPVMTLTFLLSLGPLLWLVALLVGQFHDIAMGGVVASGSVVGYPSSLVWFLVSGCVPGVTWAERRDMREATRRAEEMEAKQKERKKRPWLRFAIAGAGVAWWWGWV